jgi:hypothetical protein
MNELVAHVALELGGMIPLCCNNHLRFLFVELEEAISVGRPAMANRAWMLIGIMAKDSGRDK